MSSIDFLGASGTVTGSCYLYTSSAGTKILIDCGMYQGPAAIVQLNRHPLPEGLSSVSGMVLTHAHLDHCGRLPLLAQQHFSGPIYMTKPTRSLVELTLSDALKIAEHEKDREQLFSEADLLNVLALSKIVDYHQKFSIGGLEIELIDAGHILGSSSVIIKDGDRTVVFGADIGNYPEDLANPTEFIEHADVVVMESTYGDRNHPKEHPDTVLLQEINTIESTGGALLIPAFSLERTQVLLHKIHHAKSMGKIKPETPIYMDSPMAIKATEIYKAYHTMLNEEVKTDFKGGDPFDFPGLHVVKKPQESEHIFFLEGPKIIIAGSGMMSGGRIVGHAKNYLPLPTTRVLIIGFQAEQTLGRKISEGATQVVIDRVPIDVAAAVTPLHSMSAHADQTKLLDWLSRIKGVSQVFLTHGEDEVRQVLAGEIKKRNLAGSVVTPHLDDHCQIV